MKVIIIINISRTDESDYSICTKNHFRIIGVFKKRKKKRNIFTNRWQNKDVGFLSSINMINHHIDVLTVLVDDNIDTTSIYKFDIHYIPHKTVHVIEVIIVDHLLIGLST